MKLTFLAVVLMLTSNASARTLFLDCVLEQCAAETQCSDNSGLALHFMIDTTNQKAWRLGTPVARPVDLNMGEENRYNMVDTRADGSVEVTTIDSRMHSSHSIHPMDIRQPNNQVRQYYGRCDERKMFASKGLP